MKKETLAEYLARGGKITKVPAVMPSNKDVTVKSTVSKPPTLLSLGEAGDLLASSRSKKTKSTGKVAVNLIPAELRQKLGL